MQTETAGMGGERGDVGPSLADIRVHQRWSCAQLRHGLRVSEIGKTRGLGSTARPLYVALTYIALLAVYDVVSPLIPVWASVYALAALETAFFASFKLVKLKYSAKAFYNAFLLFLLWLMGVMLISPFLGSTESAETLRSLAAGGYLPLLVVVYVLEEPVVSEAVFRGILFQSLAPKGKALAYAVSSLAYALLMTAPMAPLDLLATFLLSLIFAYAYEKGGFTSALLLHGIYSALYAALLVLYVA